MLLNVFSKEGAQLELIERTLASIEAKFSNDEKNIKKIYEGNAVDLSDRLHEIYVAIKMIEKNI